MTSIAATISVDQRGPCGLYIISDSRITWGDEKSYWDAGRKTFASKTSPDIFGFHGDAFFPSMILGQIIDQIDSGLLFDAETEAADRHEKYISILKSSIGRAKNTPLMDFSIIHGSRDKESMKSSFKTWRTSYKKSTDKWSDKEIQIGHNSSELFFSDGSGKNTVESTNAYYVNTPIGGTSRSIIMGFCEAIRSQKDPLSAPPPQLVGIWRKGPGISFGFIFNKKRYIGGLEVQSAADYPQIRWFNENFEICDGDTMQLAQNASVHINPKIKCQKLKP